VSTATPAFLLFAVAGALAYPLNRSIAWRQLVLLAMNLYFLSTFSRDPVGFIPLAAFLAVGFVGVWLMQRGRRGWFVPVLVLEIALLVWLKKYSFIPHFGLLHFSYVTLGMSYICFRMLHMLIDAKEGSLTGVTLIGYLNYTLNFLTLVSGPIQRYEDFASTQLQATRPRLELADVGRALERIALGVFKVSLLSLLLQTWHDAAIARLGVAESIPDRVAAGIGVAAAYPLFLYANFSGYMDIVIGIGHFFRFTLPENFARPFAAPNFMTFWNRWHMTLSDFFKTYVFNPLVLALMQRFEKPSLEPWIAVCAFFITFFLLGVWHGQTSVFVVYGLILGLGVSVNKLYQVLMARRMGAKRYKALARSGLYTALCRGLTFTYFTFSLFFFWSSWRQMGELLSRVDTVSLVLTWTGLLLFATLALALVESVSRWISSWTLVGHPVFASRYVRTALTTAVILVTVTATVLMNAPAPDNVYKAF
jgi:D-alanyl-lipoteichoic acid acyltransferase DltB (MBOAT superfamily)